MDVIRIMLVDDHDLVRTGLKHILSACSDFEVVGESASGDDALRELRQLEVDIVLLDINMPGLSGFEVCDRINKYHKTVRIIVLTAHAQQPYPEQLLQAGASGFLTKACEAQELHRAIRSVSRGERYISSEIAQQLALSLLPGTADSPFKDLSAREMEVTLMISQGITVNAMAEALSISPKTVATYKYRIFEKLDVDSEVAIVRMAIKHGLLEGDEI